MDIIFISILMLPCCSHVHNTQLKNIGLLYHASTLLGFTKSPDDLKWNSNSKIVFEWNDV
jgi:hypothetical protein